MEIVKRSDGMYNVWKQHYYSWYDHEFSEWLWECGENGHDPKIWVVVDVLTPEQKELVDFVQNADGPVTFEFTLEE